MSERAKGNRQKAIGKLKSKKPIAYCLLEKLHFTHWNFCLLPFAFCLLFASCDTKRIYEENTDIPKYIWNLDFKPEFTVSITDTTLLYNIYVNIRHTKFYPNSNLWIFITTQFPEGKKLEKRVELTLADKDGRWQGDCLGDICDIRLPIQQNAFFDQTGNYIFQFAQIMRTDNLPFVMSMGLRVEKAGEKGSNDKS